MNSIETILKEINEDKHTNPTTTSNKFKTDLWEFFTTTDFSDKVCLELGTHKGQSTRVLSNIFDKVITVNKTEASFDAAKELNADRDNIEYVAFDLYQMPMEELITDEIISVAFVDAGHQTQAVMVDIQRIQQHNLADDVYYIFDDFGMHTTVYNAINHYLVGGVLEYVCDIGEGMGHDFGNGRKLQTASEGIICKLNRGTK